jgi:hypothetical protein
MNTIKVTYTEVVLMEVYTIGNTTQHDATIKYLKNKLINNKAVSTSLR